MEQLKLIRIFKHLTEFKKREPSNGTKVCFLDDPHQLIRVVIDDINGEGKDAETIESEHGHAYVLTIRDKCD